MFGQGLWIIRCRSPTPGSISDHIQLTGRVSYGTEFQLPAFDWYPPPGQAKNEQTFKKDGIFTWITELLDMLGNF